MTGAGLPAIWKIYSARGREGGEYVIDGTQITVSGEGRRWRLDGLRHATLFSEDPAAWLAAQGLRDTLFHSRRQALEAFAAVDAVCPAPREQAIADFPALLRVSAGHYRSGDGEYTARRAHPEANWQLTFDADAEMPNVIDAATLREARHFAAWHRLAMVHKGRR